MESYRVDGRSSYSRNMNYSCNDCRQMNNSGRYSNHQDRQMSMSRSRSQMSMSGRQMSNREADCSDMGILPISESSNSDCKDNNQHMRHMHLAIGYVPMQEWGDVYDLETAHCQGTIFPELNLVFCGARGKM